MSLEKDLSAVAPILFISDGGADGQLTLTTTLNLYIKQSVIVSATGLPNLSLQVKSITNKTQLLLGHIGQSRLTNVDLSAYTVVLGANLSANQQPKNPISMEDRLLGSYIQGPSNSWRVTPVDTYGNSIDNTNPLPVAFDGTVSIGDVHILGPSPTNNELNVNNDGSINVVVTSAPVSGSSVISTYNQVGSVASGATVQIVSYTVPMNKSSILQRCPISGENIARYDLLINGVISDTLRTMFGGDLTGEFDFTSGNDSGLALNSGDIVSIQVFNNRPDIADFNGRIQVLEINS